MMGANRLYLDWNATAPLHPAAREAMLRAMDLFGNPNSVHGEGRAVQQLHPRNADHIPSPAGHRPVRPRQLAHELGEGGLHWQERPTGPGLLHYSIHRGTVDGLTEASLCLIAASIWQGGMTAERGCQESYRRIVRFPAADGAGTISPPARLLPGATTALASRAWVISRTSDAVL